MTVPNTGDISPSTKEQARAIGVALGHLKTEHGWKYVAEMLYQISDRWVDQHTGKGKGDASSNIRH